MASVYYPSLYDADVVEVELVDLAGDSCSLRVLVDSGFTGKSSMVLPNEARDLVRAWLPGADTTGALQGLQDRGWVSCRIPALNFQCTLIAIFADTSS